MRARIGATGAGLALLVACSDPAGPAKASPADAIADSEAIDVVDVTGTDVVVPPDWTDQQEVQPRYATFPELNPAGCGAVPTLDWLGATAGYVPLASGATPIDAVQDKNWYLLTVLQTPQYRAAVAQDAALSQRAAAVWQALQDATSSCKADAACVRTALVPTLEAQQAAAAELVAALGATDIVSAHLRPSGRWSQHAALTDAGLLQKAAEETLAAVAEVAYGRAGSLTLPDALTETTAALQAADQPALFFEPLLQLARRGLAAEQRDEAGRYEPLVAGHNAAALAAMAAMTEADWAKYRFALMLVPGIGPTKLDIPLSQTGQDHCDLAADRWEQGVAAFILLSGGHVHPDKTPYAEAIEMKQYLMSQRGIPEAAILVDPHARHTTTNLRNAARIGLHAPIPAGKPWLVTTDLLQSIYILNLATRCEEELGFVPWRLMVRLGESDNCWLPAALSLQAGPSDERDP